MATTAIPFQAPADFMRYPALNQVLEQRTTDPTGAGLVEGRVYQDTITHHPVVYDGTVLQQLAFGGSTLTREDVEDFVSTMFATPSATASLAYTDNGASPGTLAVSVLDSPELGGELPAFYLDADNHVDGTTNHVFTALDDTKLAGIAAGATANQTDAFLLSTDNHTDGSTNHVFTAADDTKLTGIQASAIAAAAVQALIDASVAALVDTAPGTLDTLNELAAALGDDPNFATTVTNSLATKVRIIADVSVAAGQTSTTITHNLTTRKCHAWAAYDDGDFETVGVIVERPTTATMVVRYGSALTRPIVLTAAAFM